MCFPAGRSFTWFLPYFYFTIPIEKCYTAVGGNGIRTQQFLWNLTEVNCMDSCDSTGRSTKCGVTYRQTQNAAIGLLFTGRNFLNWKFRMIRFPVTVQQIRAVDTQTCWMVTDPESWIPYCYVFWNTAWEQPVHHSDDGWTPPGMSPRAVFFCCRNYSGM